VRKRCYLLLMRLSLAAVVQGVSTISLFMACGASSLPADDTESPVRDERRSLAVGSVQHVQVASRGFRRVTVSLTPNAEHCLLWTDYYGTLPGEPRPRCALDVELRDRGGLLLAPVAHNSSRNANGLEADPVDFVAPVDGQVTLRFVEVEGYSCTAAFLITSNVRIDEPPGALLVYQRGDGNGSPVGPLRPVVVLAGGGPDNDNAMKQLVNAAGKGDIVILRMDDTGGAYADYFVELGARGATELVFDADGGNDGVSGQRLQDLRRLADSSWVEAKIDAAEAVFFAGGNQTKYVDVFTGTALSRAVNRLIVRGGSLGGTSAGMHLLAGVVHTPRGGGDSVTSAMALTDPYIGSGEYSRTASLEFSPSPFALKRLEAVVADTHWSQRDRLGRSVVFLARATTDKLATIEKARLLAADEGVALVIDSDGQVQVFGPVGASASFLSADQLPGACKDNQPLEWSSGVTVQRVAASADGARVFQLPSFSSRDASVKTLTVSRGEVTLR
jgi:cyanophycinase